MEACGLGVPNSVSGEDRNAGINKTRGWLSGRVKCELQLASHSLVNG